MIKIKQEEFLKFSQYISEQYGITIKEEKKDLLVARLYKVLNQLGMKSYNEYYQYLMRNRDSAVEEKFIDCITTNHTYFMREASHFKFFIEVALPYWERRITDKDLRVWCAACSSGEEAYTLAILINEFFGLGKLSWDTTLLATDLSSEVLGKANLGIYKKEEVRKLPFHWQTRYFETVDSQSFKVKEELKKEVLFRRFNLITPTYPFKKPFHVIFCRNVMIYFNEATRQQILDQFRSVLAVGGYLFIGKSESLGINLKGFKYVSPSIYQKV